jgi:hypothetical protein
MASNTSIQNNKILEALLPDEEVNAAAGIAPL